MKRLEDVGVKSDFCKSHGIPSYDRAPRRHEALAQECYANQRRGTELCLRKRDRYFRHRKLLGQNGAHRMAPEGRRALKMRPVFAKRGFTLMVSATRLAIDSARGAIVIEHRTPVHNYFAIFRGTGKWVLRGRVIVNLNEGCTRATGILRKSRAFVSAPSIICLVVLSLMRRAMGEKPR